MKGNRRMFEYSSFVPRRYRDEMRKPSKASRLGFIGSPEFESIFEELFKGIDVEKIIEKRLGRIDKPKVSINNEDDDPEIDKKLKDDFKWKVEGHEGEDDEDEGMDEGDAYEDADEEENEEPYIHEYDVIYAEDEEDEEVEEPENKPQSIFDMLSSGKKFSDIVPVQPKHTEIYKQAFGLDDNGDPISVPDPDESKDEKNDMFVFIANKLTFLIQTIQPVIFDTSSIEVKDNTLTVAINEEKTFPKIGSIDELGYITCKVNCSPTIQRAIDEFFGDDCYCSSIYCFPTKTVDRHGKDVFAIKFVCYRK